MDCRLEGIELGKYQLVFASAEKVFVKPFLLLIRKKNKIHTELVSEMVKHLLEPGKKWL